MASGESLTWPSILRQHHPYRSVPLVAPGRTVHTLGDDGAIMDWLVSPAWHAPVRGPGLAARRHRVAVGRQRAVDPHPGTRGGTVQGTAVPAAPARPGPGVGSWALPGRSVALTGPARTALTISRPGVAAVPVVLDDRDLTVAVLPSRVRSAPEGSDPAVWRREVLAHAASSGPGVARALAADALALGLDELADDLRGALEMVSSRADCADFEALGLLNLWHALGDRWPSPDLRNQVKQALLGFKYWIDQPGLDPARTLPVPGRTHGPASGSCRGPGSTGTQCSSFRRAGPGTGTWRWPATAACVRCLPGALPGRSGCLAAAAPPLRRRWAEPSRTGHSHRWWPR
jgi:hypothetical protein